METNREAEKCSINEEDLQMNQKKIAKTVLATVAISAVMPFSALAATDTRGHWAEHVLNKWEIGKLLSGYEDGTIRPDQKITRAEFVSLVNRAADFQYTGNQTAFKDIKKDAWYYKQVAIAVNEGFMGGFEDQTFRPDTGLTRGQAASVLARLEKLKSNEEKANEFKDSHNMPHWAKGSIGAVLEAGLMVGDPDGSFHAERVLTRAEAVAVLDRAGLAENMPTPELSGVPSKVFIDYELTPGMTEAEAERIQKQVKVATVTVKDADKYEQGVTAVTTYVMPKNVHFRNAVLPKGSTFKAYNETIVLKKDLTALDQMDQEITVGEVLDVIDHEKSQGAVRKLSTLERDRVLIDFNHVDAKNQFTWVVQAMSAEEQEILFSLIEVHFRVL